MPKILKRSLLLISKVTTSNTQRNNKPQTWLIGLGEGEPLARLWRHHQVTDRAAAIWRCKARLASARQGLEGFIPRHRKRKFFKKKDRISEERILK